MPHTPLISAQTCRPIDSIRDYVAALEARGRLLRIESMDQDQYEITAFAYRLLERCGSEAAPAFLVERVRIDGMTTSGTGRAKAGDCAMSTQVRRAACHPGLT